MNLKIRYSNHPSDVKIYTTERLRNEFLITNLFINDEINLTYSHHDRVIVGGIMPVENGITLENTKELGSNYFLELREMGVINIGGEGLIIIDQKEYPMNLQDGIYIGRGVKDISFSSKDYNNPAKFYLLSYPAHQSYPIVHIPLEKAKKVHLGSDNNSNKRTINQYIHPDVCRSCQLVMGLTMLNPNNMWNTMPTHTHERRMEVYFYFNLSENDLIVHLMGEPNETRHLIVRNEEAIISPSWSIHSGVGTSNYSFIWGMGGENQTFTDMDFVEMKKIR